MSVFDSLLSLGQTIKVNSGKNHFGLTQKKKNLHVNVASADVGGVHNSKIFIQWHLKQIFFLLLFISVNEMLNIHFHFSIFCNIKLTPEIF